ncbi:MAG: sulfatase, partial [Acidobacteria bacterium]|nr:sulfatase [Acidobacteriota bacterium]
MMHARDRRWLPMILGLALTSCAGSSRPPSVVLITIDTLRADHLGCYGYDRATSPRIDHLAERGVLFTRITTSLPRTTQSIASILTGRFPKHHGARGLFSHLAAQNESLAEILKRAGFQTAAFVSNMFLRPGQGFEQGFDLYDNPERRWHGNSAPEITEAAVRWLGTRSRDRPFFLWVHYLDPHWTYEPPAPFGAQVGGAVPSFTPYEDLTSGRLTKGELIFQNSLSEEQRRSAVALYDGEIVNTDASLGPLLDAIDRFPEPILVVLTSDHGESLGEHDYFYAHGEYLYEPGL